MAKANIDVSKTPFELAEALGLSPSKAVEWEVRHQLTTKIQKIIETEKLTISQVAKNAGTSRARITEVVKGNTEGISVDVLLRVLGALGNRVKMTFKKVS